MKQTVIHHLAEKDIRSPGGDGTAVQSGATEPVKIGDLDPPDIFQGQHSR